MDFVTRHLVALLDDIFTRSRHFGKTMISIFTSLIQGISPGHRRLSLKAQDQHARHGTHKSTPPAKKQNIEAFVSEVQALLEAPLKPDKLMSISDAFCEEYKEKLQVSDISMLPSYHHTLPKGTERGKFFSLDVGGSTLRIASVELSGSRQRQDPVHIHGIRSFAIDEAVRGLKGRDFFDWVADRIASTLAERNVRPEADPRNGRLDMGLTWSFPVEQTSQRSGRLMIMGKGFRAAQGVENEDLGALMTAACRAKNINVEMRALVNDSAATLLSQAYRDPSTRISLILGTGTNAAVYLPTSALAPSKFASRPQTWHADPPSHVLVNTELSVVGHRTLPLTRWDQALNSAHPHPNLQPLEYLTTGRYMGEIARLALLEAIRTHGLFGGNAPPTLLEPYTLSALLLAAFEAAAADPALRSAAAAAWQQAHPLASAPSLADLRAVRALSVAVTARAAAYQACAVHALWKLRSGAENLPLGDKRARVTVACTGSIVEKFPGFRARMQGFLDALVAADGVGAGGGVVVLKVVGDSSVEGAAVACGCLEEEDV